MKLSEYDKVIGTYKMYILDFDIGDLRSGRFRDLPIISQWAKIKLPVLCFMLSLYEWNHIS